MDWVIIFISFLVGAVYGAYVTYVHFHKITKAQDIYVREVKEEMHKCLSCHIVDHVNMGQVLASKYVYEFVKNESEIDKDHLILYLIDLQLKAIRRISTDVRKNIKEKDIISNCEK